MTISDLINCKISLGRTSGWFEISFLFKRLDKYELGLFRDDNKEYTIAIYYNQRFLKSKSSSIKEIK